MLYHKSNPKNRTSIQENGLIPQIGFAYQCHYEDNGYSIVPRIFACRDKEYDTTWDDDVWCINENLCVQLNINFQLDEAFSTDKIPTNYLCTTQLIPNQCISLIYEGSGKDLL